MDNCFQIGRTEKTVQSKRAYNKKSVLTNNIHTRNMCVRLIDESD